ncbi:hypothetical protein LINPERHAP1_LOCUS10001 [Linum perenne]
MGREVFSMLLLATWAGVQLLERNSRELSLGWKELGTLGQERLKSRWILYVLSASWREVSTWNTNTRGRSSAFGNFGRETGQSDSPIYIGKGTTLQIT